MVFLLCSIKKIWDVIKMDLMALVRGFEKGDINIARLNYAMITLILKRMRPQL
jgi:hypothetical protein